ERYVERRRGRGRPQPRHWTAWARLTSADEALPMVRRQLVAGLAMTIVMTVLTGILCPLAVTGASQVLFSHRADGSFVTSGGKVVGSALIGQTLKDPKFFWHLPSAAGS